MDHCHTGAVLYQWNWTASPQIRQSLEVVEAAPKDVAYHSLALARPSAPTHVGLFGKLPVSQNLWCTIILITTPTRPYIDFSGAIWNTRPNMQVLSTALPLCYHQTDGKMRAMVARHVGALRNALQSLKTYYNSELNTTLPSPDPDLKFLDSKFPDAKKA
jgi:hypothetical protein